jgi:hypothetical protein
MKGPSFCGRVTPDTTAAGKGACINKLPRLAAHGAAVILVVK